MKTNSIICIPARLGSTRLPRKPLCDIDGVPMIVRVWRQAIKANLGDVLVACDHRDIAALIEAEGGQAVLTDPDHLSGSDRIFEAMEQVDPKGIFDTVINLQGDLPNIDPMLIRKALTLLETPEVDIGTLVTPLREEEYHNPNVVKAILDFWPETNGAVPQMARAVYFTRHSMILPGSVFHHIGLYVYRRKALERFVGAPSSSLEKCERLEQLRALALGMRIDAALVDQAPLGVDTLEDLEQTRKMFSDGR